MLTQSANDPDLPPIRHWQAGRQAGTLKLAEFIHQFYDHIVVLHMLSTIKSQQTTPLNFIIPDLMFIIINIMSLSFSLAPALMSNGNVNESSY
jgi:hypothetical protein